MADSSVSVKDATDVARPVDTRKTANGDERQVTVVGNAADVTAGVTPWGALEVFTGYQTLFYDSWTGPLDTTNEWTVVGNAPQLAAGDMQMPTAAGYHALRTKDTIRPNAGNTLVRNGITLEATAATGAGRFWGLGTPATTPSPTSLVQDGVGFEVDQATGNLLCVTYNAGARNTVATVTVGATIGPDTIPNFRDGNPHAYHVIFRVTGVSWYVDNTAVPVASVSFPPVAVVELPALIVRQNVGSFTGTPVFRHIAHLTADSSRAGMSIADPDIGTRVAKVAAAGGGALQVADPASSSATRTSVAAAAASTALLAANPLRVGFAIENDSAATLYLALGGAMATINDRTVSIAPGGYYEPPTTSRWVGAVTGWWSTATGSARVTELI